MNRILLSFLYWLKRPKSPIALLAAFVFFIWFLFRFIKLPSTLFFFNDMGRDLLVVWQSWHEKKPFLLGPQNSALPFNQPAMYFYLLYPAFLLSGMSLYTHTLTFLVAVGGLLLMMTKWLWNKKTWLFIFLATVWLMALQPQFVVQNRFIWNPSFVPYFVLLAVIAYGQLLIGKEKTVFQLEWKNRELWLWAVGLAVAIAFSYSIAPLAIAFVVLILWQWRKQSIKFAATLASVLVALHLPTLLFELRYHFQLTRAVLWGERPPQVSTSIFEKSQQLLLLFMGTPISWQSMLLLGVLFLFIAINIILLTNTKKLKRDRIFVIALQLFLVTLLITLVLPVAVQAHYVFALFTVLFVVLASMRIRLLVPVLLILTLWWLKPGVMELYLTPAPRSMVETEQCGVDVCSAIHEPVFVSVESAIHPYHNGPEWRFIFAKHGCDVKAIETEPGTANTMLVVADQGTYVHGKTSYNELSQFGNANETGVVQCPGNVEVHVLERD